MNYASVEISLLAALPAIILAVYIFIEDKVEKEHPLPLFQQLGHIDHGDHKIQADADDSGGTLHDEWLPDNHIRMTGPAETAFEGEI